MSEYVHRIPIGNPTGASGAPPQEMSNSGSGMLNNSLTVNNGAMIAVAASSGKQIISTVYGAAIDQMGNAQLEQNLSYISRGVGYLGVALINPYLALGKVAVDVASAGIQRAVYNQQVSFDNEYKRATSGGTTSLSKYYG
jgi:hypothetical protein